MRAIKVLCLISLVVLNCKAHTQTIRDSSSYKRYGKEISYLLKSRDYILSREGKPDSVYIVPHQGIIINYHKREGDKSTKYIRDVQYFFYYTNRRNSKELIDTCGDVVIEEPVSQVVGWIRYLDGKYPKEPIVNGEDNLGSIGCEREWDYTKSIRICLSRYKGKVTIQLNFKPVGSM